jgi:hypothetical protein
MAYYESIDIPNNPVDTIDISDVTPKQGNTNHRRIINIPDDLIEQFNSIKAEQGLISKKGSNQSAFRYLMNNYSSPNNSSRIQSSITNSSTEEPPLEKIHNLISFELPKSQTESIDNHNMWQYIIALLLLLDSEECNTTEHNDILKILNFIFNSIDNIFVAISQAETSCDLSPECVYKKVSVQNSEECQTATLQASIPYSVPTPSQPPMPQTSTLADALANNCSMSVPFVSTQTSSQVPGASNFSVPSVSLPAHTPASIPQPQSPESIISILPIVPPVSTETNATNEPQINLCSINIELDKRFILKYKQIHLDYHNKAFNKIKEQQLKLFIAENDCRNICKKYHNNSIFAENDSTLKK